MLNDRRFNRDRLADRRAAAGPDSTGSTSISSGEPSGPEAGAVKTFWWSGDGWIGVVAACPVAGLGKGLGRASGDELREAAGDWGYGDTLTVGLGGACRRVPLRLPLVEDLARLCAGCGGAVGRLRTVEVCGRPRLDDRDGAAGEALSSVLMSSI